MAYDHAGRYGTDSLTRRNGRPVPAGTEVVVYEAGTTTPATLYADRDRAPADNPAVVTALGNLTFFAEPGEYDLLVGSTTLRVVAVPDPRDTDAVASVNGETGVVVLDAADVGAVPTARTITAGTGLTGGGDLSADRTLAVSFGATAGTAAEGNDARLTNARTPTAHAASHQDGGTDELALDGSQITSGTVGTARLGSGSASSATFLRGDQTWGTPSGDLIVPRVVGEWYSVAGAPNATAVLGGTMALAGRLTAIPVYLHAGNLDRIAVYTTSAGAGTTWRLGVYPSSPTTGLPDGLAVAFDAGTVDMGATAGLLTITISQAITTAGLYWLCALCDAYSANPTAYGWPGVAASPAGLAGVPTSFAINPDRHHFARTASGVATGAIPATCPTLAWGNTAPKIAVRAAT